jgi:hypothetical protein
MPAPTLPAGAIGVGIRVGHADRQRQGLSGLSGQAVSGSGLVFDVQLLFTTFLVQRMSDHPKPAGDGISQVPRGIPDSAVACEIGYTVDQSLPG